MYKNIFRASSSPQYDILTVVIGLATTSHSVIAISLFSDCLP